MGEIDFAFFGPRVQKEKANRTGSRFFVEPDISLRDVGLILGRYRSTPSKNRGKNLALSQYKNVLSTGY